MKFLQKILRLVFIIGMMMIFVPESRAQTLYGGFGRIYSGRQGRIYGGRGAIYAPRRGYYRRVYNNPFPTPYIQYGYRPYIYIYW